MGTMDGDKSIGTDELEFFPVTDYTGQVKGN